MGRGTGIRARGTSIQISFYWKGKRFQPTLQMEPTKANLKYAERLRSTILLEIAQGTFDPSKYFRTGQETKIPTVREALESWLVSIEKQTASSTLRDYKSAVRYHLIPAFGDLPLDKLSAQAVRTWMAGLKEITHKRINNILVPLRGALGDAFHDGVIDRNPMDRIKNLPLETREPDPFTPEEVGLILHTAEGTFRNLIQFAFWTGLRTSELIALEWGDVDWKRGSVFVRRAIVRNVVKETKTKAGMREVKLLDPAREAVEAQKEHSLLPGGRIFTNPITKKPWNDDTAIMRHWQSVLKKSGIRYRNPYQTRHTYASLLLSAGENPMWVASQMGHADWGMIRKRYGRWIPSVDPSVGEKANRIAQKIAPDGDNMVTSRKTESSKALQINKK